MASPVESAFRTAVANLDAVKVRWALIGGLAVSVRAVPRFTKDLDFAIAVANDSEAEDVVHRLRGRGYEPVEVLEQAYVERLSGVRLERGGSDVIMDVLSAPVATTGHLIALKVLAGRNQDLTDLASLIPAASTEDLGAAREAVRLIHGRGFNREQDIAADLDKLIAELGR
jgi:hypothetical protein